jgi:putative flippase GtrA
MATESEHDMSEPTGTPRRRLVTMTELRGHPAPRYLLAGGVTFLIDIGSLRLLHGVAGIPLVPATVGAFCVAFAFNFTVSRRWTFAASASEGRAHRQLARYLAVVAANLASTVAIVAGLSSFGLNYLIAKVVAACVNAVGNFFASRHWIFAAPTVR